MRKIAIIGSGQAGLLAAHALVAKGYEVTLFSDRTADDWLHRSTPTGTAARFENSLAFERELGLAHWHDEAPKVEGIYLHFCPDVGNQLLTLCARMPSTCLAIDLRLQCHRWMIELEARGGAIEIAKVTVPMLEEIAAEHDLTLVAAGRGELSALFARDPQRSVYDRPQRKLCMLCVCNTDMRFEGFPVPAVKFNFIGTCGESFWIPYFHKDVGPSYNVIIEARPGSIMDRFDGVNTGEEALVIAKQLYKELFPWDFEWLRHAEISDARGWLRGSFPPTVRDPVGTLPSGTLVHAIGDTCMALDPIGGQGANNGSRMVQNLVASVVARGPGPFDAAWMRDTFERFYAATGRVTYEFNNILLEPLTTAGKLLLASQYGSDGRESEGPGVQRLADVVAENFTDPTLHTSAFLDPGHARELIARATGRPWWQALARGGAGIARSQLRQKLGRPPLHPPRTT